MASPTASSKAVLPPVTYSSLVKGFTSFIFALSCKTEEVSEKTTVETKTSLSTLRCLSITELNPPIVSLSNSYIEPLQSIIKTNSVRPFLINNKCSLKRLTVNIFPFTVKS